MNMCSPAVWIGIGGLIFLIAVLTVTNLAMFDLYDKVKRDLDTERYINERLNYALKSKKDGTHG